MYRYLITYYEEPFAIADSEEMANRVMKNYEDVSDISKFSITPLRYYQDEGAITLNIRKFKYNSATKCYTAVNNAMREKI